MKDRTVSVLFLLWVVLAALLIADVAKAEPRPIMYRESRCTNARNYNPRTRDDSYGVLQVNRYGALDAGWNSVGISRSYMATPEGAVHAASMLYHSCESLGPWTKPYSCKKWLF